MYKLAIAVSVLVVLYFSDANAAGNNSHVNPAARRPASCPVQIGSKASTYSKVECRAGNNHLVTYRQWLLRLNDYFVSHMCYRPSCYYQANAYVDENYPVQPLTPNANLLIQILDNNITLAKLNASRTNIYGYHGEEVSAPPIVRQIEPSPKVQSGLGFVPAPSGPTLSGTGNVHFQPSPARHAGPLFSGSRMAPWPDNASPSQSGGMGLIEPGGGTSAIQGLLWAWRMVSNNWEGAWATRSSYESSGAEATIRAELPNENNLKNIILISDGADTDGPIPTNSVQYDTSIGDELGQRMPVGGGQLGGETCDAHVPTPSITDQDYQDLCEVLYQQGIRVHVIYYGYTPPGGGDRRLGYCAARTRGLKFNNTINLVSAFNQILASIAAQNIRLIEK